MATQVEVKVAPQVQTVRVPAQRSVNDIQQAIHRVSKQIGDAIRSRRDRGLLSRTEYIGMLIAQIYALRWTLGQTASDPVFYCPHCGAIYKGDTCSVCGGGGSQNTP